MFIRDNFEAIVRSVANQYRSKGTEQVINEIKNPSYKTEKTPPTVEKNLLWSKFLVKYLETTS